MKADVSGQVINGRNHNLEIMTTYAWGHGLHVKHRPTNGNKIAIVLYSGNKMSDLYVWLLTSIPVNYKPYNYIKTIWFNMEILLWSLLMY